MATAQPSADDDTQRQWRSFRFDRKLKLARAQIIDGRRRYVAYYTRHLSEHDPLAALAQDAIDELGCRAVLTKNRYISRVRSLLHMFKGGLCHRVWSEQSPRVRDLLNSEDSVDACFDSTKQTSTRCSPRASSSSDRARLLTSLVPPLSWHELLESASAH